MPPTLVTGATGLVGSHLVRALLARGEGLPNTEQGWSTIRSMGRSREAGVQEHVKLLGPRDEIKSVLDMVGFTTVFAIFSNFDEAIQSF